METKATVHLFSAHKIGYNTEEADRPPSIEDIERAYPGFTVGLKRGDILENVDEGDYRSSTIYFYNGTNIIYKETGECDDYGTPPTEFALITEFPPGYWDQPYNQSRGLVINDRFEPGCESDFYWHSDETWSPIDLEKLGIQGAKLTKVVEPWESNPKYSSTYYYCTFTYGDDDMTYFLAHESERLPESGVLHVFHTSAYKRAPDGAVCLSSTY